LAKSTYEWSSLWLHHKIDWKKTIEFYPMGPTPLSSHIGGSSEFSGFKGGGGWRGQPKSSQVPDMFLKEFPIAYFIFIPYAWENIVLLSPI